MEETVLSTHSSAAIVKRFQTKKKSIRVPDSPSHQNFATICGIRKLHNGGAASVAIVVVASVTQTDTRQQQ